MVKQFKLPDIGEGVHEGEITKWLVKEGDPIKEEQPFVEVMTDKVTVELPSPYTGTVRKLLAKVGEVVKVGNPIIEIREAGEPSTAAEVPATAEAAPPAAPTRKPAAAPAPPPAAAESGTVLATPAIRRLARELTVELDSVRGTGPRGRITEEDIRAAASGAKPAIAAKPEVARAAPAGAEERIPIQGIRRRIAEKMQKSKNTAAHFTFVEEVDMTHLIHTRDRLKAKAEKKGVKLTYLPFIVRAVVASLKEHPSLNGSVDDERQEIVVKRYYNIGIATATEAGLIVPVVHDADTKDLYALAAEIERLAEAARTGKLTPHDVSGGTFTITSLGAQGGILATPIINWPEVAIVGIHRIEKRPVVHGHDVVVRDMMYVTCSFDHRAIDGHVGAAFVETLKEYLEHPALLFVEG